MTKMRVFSLLAIAAVVGSCAPAEEEPMEPMMSFFLTSAGPGNGADLGGLEGADAHCLRLADDVGAGTRIWAVSSGSPPRILRLPVDLCN